MDTKSAELSSESSVTKMGDENSSTDESSAITSADKNSSTDELPSESSVASADKNSSPNDSLQDSNGNSLPSKVSSSGISSWARRFKLPQQLQGVEEYSKVANEGISTFARFTGSFRLGVPSIASETNEGGASTTAQSGVVESLAKGIVDSSRSAVKAMQVKARHIVSQNKRRYQEGGFDLDMTYITENIIAMGFPAGDISSGIFGYLEGFYRNHMEEVIKFFESHHEGKYKVYNLCSERLYDASLFEGKVANFPFDDHNCPPLHLIKSFCQSAYSWLKEDIENVVVVHCKAGMGRTGLMICSLLLFVKFFPTAEGAINYYNQKRCVDGKALVLPSQIRYVKYFESILTTFNGENQPGRKCMLRGFRIQKCPYWLRPSITISNHNGILFSTRTHPKTKNLMPEDFWLRATKKEFVVFALPGEPGLTELVGDFKIHFHDRQGDFYCWLNTAMMENRTFLDATELDGFDKKKLTITSPGFQVEVVMIDYNATLASNSVANSSGKPSNRSSSTTSTSHSSKDNEQDNDDVFSDSDGEDTEPANMVSARPSQKSFSEQVVTLGDSTGQLALTTETCDSKKITNDGELRPSTGIQTQSPEQNDFRVIAADASVFSFGDEEDLDSD